MGEALSEELREASFSQAMEFFANRFSDGVYPFFGESWMLDPDMISLQKQIAEFLEEGGKLGAGTGIFIRKQVVTEKKRRDRTVFFL